MAKCPRERKRCALDADGVQPPQVLAVVVGGIQDLHRSKQQQRRASSITERMTQPPLSWPLIAGDLDPSAPGDRRCRPVVDGDPIHLRIVQQRLKKKKKRIGVYFIRANAPTSLSDAARRNRLDVGAQCRLGSPSPLLDASSSSPDPFHSSGSGRGSIQCLPAPPVVAVLHHHADAAPLPLHRRSSSNFAALIPCNGDPETDVAAVIDYVDDDPSSLSSELPDGGSLEPDATADGYCYLETTDDQE
ncbi:uncharacterized protein LOC119309516 [Triticum dicoccoides]|uniref:uncharacterized protein LOC119309516 n=1 Tax=Triticum dicoccoides TaxID=85692 RepID=UPI001891BB63|nr:uncharacterized protein LOC119309516 [Triticum dicoccoides]